MAGYRITYDGSNTDRRDVPQLTAGNNLTSSTIDSPEGASTGDLQNWDAFNATEYINRGTAYDVSNLAIQSTGLNTNVPNDYIITGEPSLSTNVFGPTYDGSTVTIFTGSASDYGIGVFSPSYPVGTVIEYDIQITGISSSPNARFEQVEDNGNSRWLNWNSGSPVIFINSNVNSLVLSGQHTITAHKGQPTQYLRIIIGKNFSGPFNLVIDRIRFSTISPVTITPSTQTAGVAPTGTTGVIESVATDTQGQAAVAGPPKDFGINVIHDSSTIAEAGFLPSAQNTEDASKDVATSKIITATDTSVTVEAFGLGGAERLAAGETKIVVEDLEDTTEN